MKSSYGVLILISLGGAHAAFADGVGDSRAGLDKAYGDYYKALRSKSGFTQEDSSRLSKQIVTPAQRALQSAIREQTRKTAVEAKKRRTKLNHGDFAGAPPGAKGTDESGAPPSESRATTQAAPHATGPSQPKVVLDGSRIPREIEFSGAKKAEPSPAAPAK